MGALYKGFIVSALLALVGIYVVIDFLLEWILFFLVPMVIFLQ